MRWRSKIYKQRNWEENKYPRQNRCDIVGREVVANAHERSSSRAAR
jgi:hypothetical protein